MLRNVRRNMVDIVIDFTSGEKSKFAPTGVCAMVGGVVFVDITRIDSFHHLADSMYWKIRDECKILPFLFDSKI